MKVFAFVSRFRLLLNILALALALGVLAASPATVSANPPVCSGGCIDWNAQQGCVTYQYCCVYSNGYCCTFY